MTTTSVYIPFVFANVTQEYIKKRFEQLQVGTIDHVDMVPKERSFPDGSIEYYFMAFVHFKEWSSLPAAQNIKEKIEAGEQAALNYDDPWYWVLWKNKCPEVKEVDDSAAKIDCLMDMIESLQKRVLSLENDSDILSDRIKHNRGRRFDLEDCVHDNLKPFINQLDTRLSCIETHHGQNYDVEANWSDVPIGLRPTRLVRQTATERCSSPCFIDLACPPEDKAEMIYASRKIEPRPVTPPQQLRQDVTRELCDN